jgi:hypothetical protein
MPAGKGRIVLRDGFVMAVAYEYAASRRLGVLEGILSGRLAWLPRATFFDEIDLVCQDGTTLQLTITTYSDSVATFTGTRRVGEEVENRYRYLRAGRSA